MYYLLPLFESLGFTHLPDSAFLDCAVIGLNSGRTKQRGRPWEIFRSQNLAPAHPHTIDIYTKGGAAYGYEATMGVIDQYGIGYVVLTAGARGPEAQMPLVQALLVTLTPVVEDKIRETADTYAGTCTGVLGEMVVGIGDGPRLRLLNLSLNGTDMHVV
ncbi:hypothetical protein BDZ45DRAFT_693805 [Acephala macrosclerotiorum]|nr:hypothetical protein BDZ45DRAFT_693805 [Acephala macrosclerotiorum]